MAVRAEEKLTLSTSMTFTAELHPPKLKKISLLINSNTSQMWEALQQNTQTHEVLIQTFLFTALLVYFSREKKLGNK